MPNRSIVFDHIYPNIEDWPIYKLSEDREAFIDEINSYTYHELISKDKHNLTEILAKTVYQELNRIKENPWRVDPPNELLFWKKIQHRLNREDKDYNDKEYRIIEEEVLRRIIHRYAEEIVGTFSKNTFLFARKFLTAFFKRLLTKANGKGLFRFWDSKKRLYEKLKVYGGLDQIRDLAKDNILVLVPTHFSNLDSILIGYTLDQVTGLPSFSYGAGLNLYNSGYAAYFMNRLGAYRLDRRKKNPVYLETLKSMSTLSLLRGTNSLFFPGGGRSRSGALEDKLKLGLLSTLVESQRILCQQNDNRKVVVVPLILSYNFVLEAKYLAEEYLRKTGKEKFIRTRDLSTKKRNWLKFIAKYLFEDSEISLSFGKPMDALGNFINEDGESIDERNKKISVGDYFKVNDQIVEDAQRESEYTKLLAEKLVKQYHRENIVLNSHIVAFTAFRILIATNAGLDLYGILKLSEEDITFPFDDFCKSVEMLMNKLKEMESNEQVLLSEETELPIRELVKDGLHKLGAFHSRKPLKVNKKGEIYSEDFKLLYYYHNRLNGYNLENIFNNNNSRIVVAG